MAYPGQMAHAPQLTLNAARAIALDAQGVATRASGTIRGLKNTLDRIGLLQIDSVNVYARSHHNVAATRAAGIAPADVDRHTHHDSRIRSLGPVTEAWAHEAALIRTDDLPLFAFRQQSFRKRFAPHFESNGDLHRELLAQIRDRGPLAITEIEHEDNVRMPGGWWNKNAVHGAVGALFRGGDLVVTGRKRFERVLDVRDRHDIGDPVDYDTAHDELLRRASVHLGIATLDDLRDYYRFGYLADAKRALGVLLERGDVTEVSVEGWDRPAYLARDQARSRRRDVDAILSPFDPLVWHRPRALRLWDFHYRISIYTPALQREHGYYVMPVMIGGELVGRVDLKRDAKADALLVQHAHVEPSHAGRAAELASRMLRLLRQNADWHGLSDVRLVGPGTWTDALRAATAA